MTKKYFISMLAISALCILIGAVLIVWPEQSRLTLCYVLGAAALLYGAYRIITFFAGGAGAGGVQFGMAIGVAAAVLGLFLLLKANAVIGVLSVIIGIAVIVDSVLRIQLAVNIKRMGGRDWTPILFCALCILALGMLLLFNPFSVITTATIIAGVALVIDGGLTLWSTLDAKKLVSAAEGGASRVK